MKIFEKIIYQPQLVASLKSAILSSRNDNSDQKMMQSWIISGPPGSGRSVAAKVFAAALICRNDGCGECIDCETALNGTHLDVEIVKTDGFHIKIDEIRELISRISFFPSVSRWRAVVVENAERFTEAAANALLKAIEEPNLRTVWILCVPSDMELLPTIRSRCRHLPLQVPTKSAITDFLIDNHNIESKLAKYVARISCGDIEKSIYLAKNPDARETRDHVLNLYFQNNNIYSAFNFASKLIEFSNLESKNYNFSSNYDSVELVGVSNTDKMKKAKDIRLLTDVLRSFLNDILYCQLDIYYLKLGLDQMVINIELIQQLREFSTTMTQESILNNVKRISQTKEIILHNSSFQVTLEELMVSLINQIGHMYA